MHLLNFTNAIEIAPEYNGSEKKKTMILDNKKYLVKFPDPNRSTKLEISYIKQRLQLYTVLGTTVSFILLLINENGGIKIFITGILLDYLWINYFITDKENKLKKKDI